MARRKRAWLLSVLAFLICLPPAFFAGITLVGHARLLPYVSVWLDRLVLVAASLGMPILVAFILFRFLAADSDGADDEIAAAVDCAFPGRTREALTILRRYGTEAHEREQERVRLATIELSRGDLVELSRLVELAKQDRRDILMWAEQRREAARS